MLQKTWGHSSFTRPLCSRQWSNLIRREIETKLVSKTTTQEAFDNFVSLHLLDCDCDDISDLMRTVGMKSSSKSHLYLRRHLPAVSTQIGCLSSSVWTYESISFVINGLQAMTPNDAGSLQIIETMVKVGNITLDGKSIPTGENISMAMLGLQNYTCAERAALDFVSILTRMIPKCKSAFRPKELSHILYSLKGMRSDTDEIRAFIMAIVPKIRSNKESFNVPRISSAVYGLQEMKCTSSEVRMLVKSLIPAINIIKYPFDAQAVGNSLYGLKNMTSDSSEVRGLLFAITLRIRSCNTEFTAQNISNAMYGLRCMSAKDSDVRNILSALVPKIVTCCTPFTPQSVGSCLYGLQCVSSESEEARSLLRVLLPKVQGCTANYNSQNVANALYGLQCLVEHDDGYLAVVASMTAALVKSNRRGEAVPPQSISMALLGLQKNKLRAHQSLELLDRLTILIKSCRESSSSQQVGNALYGMQSMSSDHVEVRSMISALLDKVHSCKEPLSAHAVGNALYGMQGMSSEYSEVRSMISALAGKVLSCKEPLNAQAVSNALYGMQSMSSDLCVGILTFLLSHTSSLTELNRVSRLDLLSVGQAVLLCIPSRRDVLDDASYELWAKFGNSVCSEHRRRTMNGEYMDSYTSKAEKRIHHAAVRTLGQSSVTVSSNEYLFDMFESDIVVRIPFVRSTDDAAVSADGRWLVINIEVDGMRHKQEKKINFCKLRDAYLKSGGVVVHRIDASRVNKMDDNQLELWLLDVIAESLLLSA